jgi:hypothetical protein
MKITSHTKIALVLGLFATAIAFVGAALIRAEFASTSGTKYPPVKPITYVHRFKKRPMSVTGDPQTILNGVIARYGGTHVLSGSIDKQAGARPGTVLHFLVSAGGTSEDAIRAQWESDLIAGAVADQLANTPAKVVSTIIDARLPDGTIHSDLVGGGMGDVVANQDFRDASDDAIRMDVGQTLTEAHLDLVSLDILRPSQAAPAVVAATSDPAAAAVAANNTIQSLFGQNPPKYEGYYFEVRDKKGNPVFIQSASFRSGAGRLWFSPSVADVISLNHL